MLKAILVDDEFRSIEVLQSLLASFCPQVQICAVANDVDAAYNEILSHKPDLVFLDIEMPGGDGFSLLAKFTEINFQTVFVTSHSHYALNAIKFSALDYILKPAMPEDLMKAVEKAEERIENQNLQIKIETLAQNLKTTNRENKRLVLKTSDQIYVADVKEIVRMEGALGYTTFYLNDGHKILVSKTLKEYDDMLEGYDFLRVHQSHLINMKFFVRFDKRDGGFAVMKDGAKIPVSVRKKEELLNYLDKM
jgi:two-component system LytT family response regulator